MPIYEFKCNHCGNIFNLLCKGFGIPETTRCDKCDSGDIKKLISKVNYHSSGSDRFSSYNPNSSKSDAFYKDTRNIGLHAEQMLKKAGVAPSDDFKAKLERVRTDPGSILKD